MAGFAALHNPQKSMVCLVYLHNKVENSVKKYYCMVKEGLILSMTAVHKKQFMFYPPLTIEGNTPLETTLALNLEVKARLKKGFVDIRSDNYCGPYKATDFLKYMPEIYKRCSQEFICKDNIGFEERFDVGVTYIGETAEKSDTLLIQDRFGQLVTVCAKNFEVQKDVVWNE